MANRAYECRGDSERQKERVWARIGCEKDKQSQAGARFFALQLNLIAFWRVINLKLPRTAPPAKTTRTTHHTQYNTLPFPLFLPLRSEAQRIAICKASESSTPHWLMGLNALKTPKMNHNKKRKWKENIEKKTLEKQNQSCNKLQCSNPKKGQTNSGYSITNYKDHKTHIIMYRIPD